MPGGRVPPGWMAFFFKQWGGMRKHRPGRELFGRTFDELPVGTLLLDSGAATDT